MNPLIINNPVIDRIQKELIEIPGGKITLRDDRKKRSWTVDVQSFYLAKYPVTQELYFKVTGKSPATFKGDHLPVETVSWSDAIQFCNLLSQNDGLNPCYIISCSETEVTFDIRANGYRLPTEAEWEYGCKAGTTNARYGLIDEVAWYKNNSGGKTSDVGLKKPNGWGLYDMLGNVWEWCFDVYDDTVYDSYRIFRGGGWNDEERSCLSTNRRRSHPVSFRIDDLGFRVAKNLE